MSAINFKLTRAERRIVDRIAARAVVAAAKARTTYTMLDASMDVAACHLNGCPLRLQELLDAPDFDFVHDVWGIRRHIDRDTGALTGCFLPRYAAPENVTRPG